MIRTIEVARVARMATITASAGLAVQLLVVPVGPPSAAQGVAPASIAPTSAVGNPAIVTGLVAASPATIGFTSSVASPALAVSAPIMVAPVAIPPGAAVRAPEIVPAGVAVAPATIVSLASVKTPAIAVGAVSVTPPAIASSSQILIAAIARGAVAVTPAMIVATSSLLAPAVAVTASTYDPDALAAFNAMTVQPDATRKGLINSMIVSLKSKALWAKLDWLLWTAAHDAQAARVNLRNPAKLMSPVNSPTFVVDRGPNGDGVGVYFDFGETYNAAGNLFALDSATIGAWVNQQSSANGLDPHMGATSSARSAINGNNTGASVARINSATSSTTDNTGSRLGHRMVTRTTSTTQRLFKNGALARTEEIPSSTMASGNATLLRSSSSYGTDRVAFAYSGAGFTDADGANIHDIISSSLTAIGAN